MSDIVADIFRKYGTLAIVVTIVLTLSIWGLAHRAASPGTEVSVLWGLVKYTKPPETVSSKTMDSTLTEGKDTFKIIKCFKESSEFQSEIGTEIASAKEEIWFFGMNFYISAVNLRTKLLDKLRSGVKIRYLVLDPYFPHIDQVAKDFNQPINELKTECVKGLNDIFELKRQWDSISNQTNSLGEVEIRFYNNYPKSRLYLFDPRKPTGRTMFVPYFTRFRSPNLPGYLIENNPSSIFKSYYDGVIILWSRSYGLNTFHKEHPDFPNVPL
jgi:hypothetical protein